MLQGLPVAKFVSLFVLACTEVTNPGTCLKVEIAGPNGEGLSQLTTVGVLPNGMPDNQLVPLSVLGCMIMGETIARDFMKQHPVYGRPGYHYGGIECLAANKPPRKSGAA